MLARASTGGDPADGKGLQPRTLEVFDDLGVIDRVAAAGIAFPPFRLHAGHEVVWTRPFLDMIGVPDVSWRHTLPYPDAWLIPQSRTNEILADHLLGLGVRIDFGTRLVGFEQDADGVTAQVAHAGAAETIRARYLVGCDGGTSFVRKHLGLAFDGETLVGEYTATCGCTTCPGSRPTASTSAWSTSCGSDACSWPATPRTCIPLPVVKG
ncbi:MAG: FAD-dependent monooxygenase [Pseudonocardia sp.]